jgi:hypothetical protein
LFRLSFVSFFHTPASASVAGGASLKAVSFHKGKKRRRILYQLSKAEASFATRVQKAAAFIRSRAKAIFLSLALPLGFLLSKTTTASLFTLRARPPVFSPGSIRKHLSLSILRV